MQVLSVNVGLPKSMPWKGRIVTSGIFKQPVDGPVQVTKLNLDGDGQADLTVHGGEYKAVYAYPSEHYAFWTSEMNGMALEWGAFGENLTITGLSEETTHIGDRFRIGGAEFVVTQPRMPCYKLGMKFGDDVIIRRFLETRKTGFYFAVVTEGVVQAGDTIEQIGQDAHPLRVYDLVGFYAEKHHDRDLLSRALLSESLTEDWKDWIRKRLAR